tara:strand:- start:51 stop:536 length:486 start_codon:yes stop_codon:yes gene_type:complete
MIPTIQIKDNFLDEKEFNILCNNLDKISLKPFVQDDKKTSGFRQTFEKTSDNEWLFKKIKKQFFPNINLKEVICCYHWRHNKETVLSHVDGADFNLLLYLKGDELVYNGTGIYSGNNLNTYIGFVKNRAIFFDGKNNIHTDLQALGPSSGRYTLNIFYNHG